MLFCIRATLEQGKSLSDSIRISGRSEVGYVMLLLSSAT